MNMELVSSDEPKVMVLELHVGDVLESPTNPRKHFGDMSKLLQGIRESGVLQPIVVRPFPGQPGKYESVFGNRRLRASVEACRLTIPAIVRDLTDDQVIDQQLAEMCHGQDIHPLDEADSFKAMHEQYGYDVQQIADKVGMSKAYVYARMKLCALSEKARKAFFGGQLDASTALLVARIPVTKLQDEAVKKILAGNWDTDYEPLGYRAAAKLVQQEYMLRLGDAPFKTADETLLPAAGPCSTCPKRTGNQSELFSDVKSADVCTDPVCYGEKVAAEWRRRTDEAKKTGVKVASAKQTTALLGWGPDRGQKLDEKCSSVPGNKTYRSLLKAHLQPGDVIVARDGNVIHEIVPKAVADRILRKIQPAASKTSSGPNAYEQKRKRELAIRHRVGDIAVATVLSKVTKVLDGGSEAWWRFLATALLAEVTHDTVAAIAKRRDWPKPTGVDVSSDARAKVFLASAQLAEVEGLVVELLITRETIHTYADPDVDGPLAIALRAVGSDLAKIMARAKAEVAVEAAAKAAKKKPAKKEAQAKPKRAAAAPRVKKAKAKPETCRECGCTDEDCEGCIERTGEPCRWIEPGLCSACAPATASSSAAG